MSDTMFPEPMDQMDRAMQRMDKKAWAEADAEIATLKARLTAMQDRHMAQQSRADAAEARLAEAERLIRRAYGALGTLRRMADEPASRQSYSDWQDEADSWLKGASLDVMKKAVGP